MRGGSSWPTMSPSSWPRILSATDFLSVDLGSLKAATTPIGVPLESVFFSEVLVVSLGNSLSTLLCYLLIFLKALRFRN